ncbi:MAG TPA: hypothetical protein VLB44_18310 [Kofleriaceae bacterium]|nr:hypothetical protein [Kofleriaceae bacterium]
MKRLALVCLLIATTSASARRRPPPPDLGPDDLVAPHPHQPPVPPPPPPPPPAAADVQIDVRAELTSGGDPVRLVMTSGGKKPGARLELKGGASISLANGELVGTLKTGHGTTLIVLSVDDAKLPFRIATFDGKQVANVQKLARPAKQSNYPFAVAATRTPDGFTVFFQEVETGNPNEAHTFMVELDKAGQAGEVKEVQIPWALGDAIWNGNGYHLALFYTGEMRGARLSMVSATPSGVPQGHPDWATQPSAITDLHLVSTDDNKIRAIYRGGIGDHMYETDVTAIGQWGQVTAKTKDLGALASNVVIAINAKGQPTKVRR